MSKACKILHDWANSLPTYSHGFSKEYIPKNGIYVVFERGEKSHNCDRIVRIGTHTGQDNLGNRIYEHLYTPNKDRSIFRKHIGRCLLFNDSFLEQWNWDLTTRKNKNKYYDLLDRSKLEKIEDLVSKYIKDNLRFTVFEVKDKSDRLQIETALIATVASCNTCIPSPNWLGLKHPDSRIRNGLWNIKGLNGKPLNEIEMRNIIEYNE